MVISIKMQNLVKNFIRFFLLYALLAGAKELSAQKTFHVTIRIPPSMNSKSLDIEYDNGVVKQKITEPFNHNELRFEGPFGSKYAALNLYYKANDSTYYNDSYFINNRAAELTFSESDSSADKNPFHHCIIKNAIDIYALDIFKKIVEYSKDATNEMMNFWRANKKQINKVDSITQLFNNKLDEINKKQIQFIKNHPNDYFSFWWYRRQIVPGTLIIYEDDSTHIKKLLHILDTVFPKEFINTPEGIALRTRLTGRLSVKKNTLAPGFEAKDINGKVIRLKDFKGQYVLLDFWATWCAPCMKQIPFLEEIRQNYLPEKLAMISISADYDYNKFLSVVKEKDMNWIHIFDKDKLPGLYGISQYPTMILINKEGVIIYNGKSQDKDDLLKALQKM